ncbi:hypothetical protein [Ligilactobacillus saerimneri]|nr:hypothetical protein [Ligilactobacillus saerimneri]
MNSSDKIRKRLQLEDELLDNALKTKSLIKRAILIKLMQWLRN